MGEALARQNQSRRDSDGNLRWRKGVDTFAKLFAARHHKPYMEFAPQYDVYGRYATLKRNTQIVKEASTVIAFPSAESKGTYHTIKEAQRLGRCVIVVNL